MFNLTTVSACHIVLYSVERQGQRRNITRRTWKILASSTWEIYTRFLIEKTGEITRRLAFNWRIEVRPHPTQASKHKGKEKCVISGFEWWITKVKTENIMISLPCIFEMVTHRKRSNIFKDFSYISDDIHEWSVTVTIMSQLTSTSATPVLTQPSSGRYFVKSHAFNFI
jgi:hypothetical protein